jgi:lauroyl/myristoyl acyltransferase
MDDGIKDRLRWLFFHAVRRMERRLPVAIFYSICWVYASLRAALNRRPDPVPLPTYFGAGASIRTIRESRRQIYLNQLLEYFPERLAKPKWLGRCRLSGFDPVLRARREGRPIVFAFCHSSAYRLLRFWLRAAGIPVANLVAGHSGKRPRLLRLADSLAPFPGIPSAFYLDELRRAGEFLSTGGSLLVALDHPLGKQMSLPVGDGWTFQMATGAVRLAIHHQAELIPLVLVDEGAWRFQIRIGRPVPVEFLAARADWIQAGRHLLLEMLSHFRDHPDQFSSNLAKAFRSDS